MCKNVVFINSADLFTEVAGETALFLLFHKHHLLADSKFTFSFSVSAVFVQINAKIGPTFAYVELFMEQIKCL